MYQAVQCPTCGKYQVTSAKVLKCKFCGKSRTILTKKGHSVNVVKKSNDPMMLSKVVQELNKKGAKKA